MLNGPFGDSRGTAKIAILAGLLGASSALAVALLAFRPGLPALLALAPALGIAWAFHRAFRNRTAAGLRRIDSLLRVHASTLETLSIALDAKDPVSRGHVRRVRGYAIEIARLLGIPRRETSALRTAALLHDIGTLAIPDQLLNKPGKLSEREFQEVKAHPAIAARILAGVEFPQPVMPIILHHHERWDGSGYPDGLKGPKIPLGARVLAVADAFEALTSDRAYRPRKSPEEACALIEAWSGIHFDPKVARVLRDNLAAIVEAGRAHDAGAPAGEAAAGEAAAEGSDGGGEGVPEEERSDSGGFGGLLHRNVSAGEDEEAPSARAAAASPRRGGAAFAAALNDLSSAQAEVYALYEIAQTLGSSLRLTEVLELVASKIGQLVPFRTCAFYLLDETGETLSARFVSGANAAALRGRAVRLGEGITGWSAAHGTHRFSTSPELDLAGASIQAVEYSTVAAFPLSHDTTALGVITLYFPRDVPCTDGHIRVMDIVAKLSAGAVFNSSFLGESRESALTDDLTNLPNARYLQQAFERETIRCQQAGQPLALVQMDLDDFKPLNERYGHAVGDRYLCEVSRVLRGQLRERDVLARLSADEFAAILPLTGFAAAALLAERLQQAVDSFTLKMDGGKAARAGLSVGIALYPQDADTLEDLTVRADLNMTHNKATRKGARANRSPNIIPFPQR